MNSQETNALARYMAGEIPPIDDLQAEALYTAGHTHYEDENYSAAADVFRLLALVRPYAVRSWIALAATHEAVGDDERAVALYGIATAARDAADAEIAAAYVHLARTEHKLGANDEALADLERYDALATSCDIDTTISESAAWLRAELRRGGAS
jgi:tetratricopeptide (TPR) repeat protein